MMDITTIDLKYSQTFLPGTRIDFGTAPKANIFQIEKNERLSKSLIFTSNGLAAYIETTYDANGHEEKIFVKSNYQMSPDSDNF
jgi:hypothetical protein